MGFPKYDYPDGLLVFATWYYLAAVVCLIQHSLSLIGWTIYSREIILIHMVMYFTCNMYIFENPFFSAHV